MSQQLIRGTIAELADRLTFNGKPLGQPELSMLTRLGRGVFCNVVGTIKQVTRGKPTNVWEINTSFTASLAMVDTTAPVITAPDAGGVDAASTEAEVIAEPAAVETETEVVEQNEVVGEVAATSVYDTEL